MASDAQKEVVEWGRVCGVDTCEGNVEKMRDGRFQVRRFNGRKLRRGILESEIGSHTKQLPAKQAGFARCERDSLPIDSQSALRHEYHRKAA